ncbi:MAG: alpha/beta hydrolase-fold protein [Saprospiraceae bacterium]
MHREIKSWYSPILQKEMEIVEYGHFGFVLLLLPTAAADYLEYERFLMIDVLQKYIDQGKVKVYSINSINSESWLNSKLSGKSKISRHLQFNEYVYQEVVPFIKSRTSQDTPIITCGASFGGLHAANLFFKNPFAINGCIAMSGVYNLGYYTKQYWDTDCFWNSPLHYLKEWNDQFTLDKIRQSNHIHILTGSGDYEDPDASRHLSGLLHHREIPHDLDVWGYDIKHDWPTWRMMLPYIIDQKF